MGTGGWELSWTKFLLFGGAGVGFLVAYLNRPSFMGLSYMPFENWIQLSPGQIIGHMLVGAVIGAVAGYALDQRRME